MVLFSEEALSSMLNVCRWVLCCHLEIGLLYLVNSELISRALSFPWKSWPNSVGQFAKFCGLLRALLSLLFHQL